MAEFERTSACGSLMSASDRAITALAVDGLYRTDHHLAVTQGHVSLERDSSEVVAAHVRRLEALRRAGIVERVAKAVPDDLVERGRRYDIQRQGGVTVEQKSHLPIGRQARVIGATLIGSRENEGRTQHVGSS